MAMHANATKGTKRGRVCLIAWVVVCWTSVWTGRTRSLFNSSASTLTLYNRLSRAIVIHATPLPLSRLSLSLSSLSFFLSFDLI